MNRHILRRIGLALGSVIAAMGVVSIWAFDLEGDDTYFSFFLFVIGIALFTFSAPAIRDSAEPTTRGFDVIVRPTEAEQKHVSSRSRE